VSVVTVVDRVLAFADARPEAPALLTPEVSVSYGELAERVRAASARLARDGVGPGERVVVALPNLPATVVVSLAAQALGACVVEVNRDTADDALAAIVAAVQPRVRVVWGRDARRWGALDAAGARTWVIHGQALPEKMLAAFGAEGVRHLMPDGRLTEAEDAPTPPLATPAPEDPALLVYTSGSTGRPRGVIHSFANIEANTRSIVGYLELDESDRAMLVMPLSYTFGKSVLQTYLFVGGSVFLDHRFMYPRVVMEAIAEAECTGFYGVPLTYELLRRQLKVGEMSFPALRVVCQAGGHLDQSTREWSAEVFAPARFFVMYGQTEATARLAYLPPERLKDKARSIGRAIPDVELRVVDDAGRELPPGETGQLVARGRNVTPGYFGDPEASAEVLKDGWLWTGDLAYRDDDGFFFLTGRAKEMLKIGGHRVSPREIEQALLEHPAVIEVAVAGVPDGVSGEAAAAFVVTDDLSVEEAELKRLCRRTLPPYKVPRSIVFLEKLPRNHSGKVAREQLPVDELLAEPKPGVE
jgi:acyl-CoA synthetase (AMP-forming)/AMP-acid ligase II